jgi:prephenate dehydrogenase
LCQHRLIGLDTANEIILLAAVSAVPHAFAAAAVGLATETGAEIFWAGTFNGGPRGLCDSDRLAWSCVDFLNHVQMTERKLVYGSAAVFARYPRVCRRIKIVL